MVNRVIRKPNEENMVQIGRLSAELSKYIWSNDLKKLYLYLYNYMKDNSFNPISCDIQYKYNYHEIFLEFHDINECWKCYRFINEKTTMHCIIRKYAYDDYAPSILYRRMPYCRTCIQRRATHCKMLYCKACARNQDTFSKTFYEIPTGLFSSIIVKYLKISDVCSLQQTCKEMNLYFNDNDIWEPHISENVWFPYITDVKHVLYKTFYMNKKCNYTQRMKTKSATIIQKYTRRFNAKRKHHLLIRDSLSVLMNYYHSDDYTRSPMSTLTRGTDLLTQNTHVIFMEKLKIRTKYREALNQIEEPTFD